MIQQNVQIFGFVPLKGYFQEPEQPELSLQSWLEGDFQDQQLKYLDYHIGFRNIFVRLYNQIHYTLYNQARANGVIIGKDNYLYEENYIKAHLGRDFIGRDTIIEKVRKLRQIQDTLKQKQIDVIVLFAPGKASFYPEYIPDRYEPNRRTTTNYELYKEELSKAGIPVLDFHKWFRDMKDTAPHPLFPKTGIHWSKYGQALAADSMIKFVYQLRNTAPQPDVSLGEIETSTRMRNTDQDIEEGMNLLADIGDLEMGYPDFQIHSDSASNTVKALTVADSYYLGLKDYGCSEKAFDHGDLWFYNKQIYTENPEDQKMVKDIDIVEKVENNDVVLLLSTDANLFKFAFGFIDQLYDAYFDPHRLVELKKAEEMRIQKYIHAIRNTPEWLQSIESEAEAKGIPLEELIRGNAEYMVWQEEQEKQNE